jgi:hypothetical protein
MMKHTLTLTLALASSTCLGQVYYQGPRMQWMQAQAAAAQSQAALNYELAEQVRMAPLMEMLRQPTVIVEQAPQQSKSRRVSRNVAAPAPYVPERRSYTPRRSYIPQRSYSSASKPNWQLIVGLAVLAYSLPTLAISAWKFHKSRTQGGKR